MPPAPKTNPRLYLLAAVTAVACAVILVTDQGPIVAASPLLAFLGVVVFLQLRGRADSSPSTQPDERSQATSSEDPPTPETAPVQPSPAHPPTRQAPSNARFVAQMSREIRTPMNGILGTSELLLGSELDGDQQEYARTIHESAKALLSIIDQVRDLAKLETGDLQLEQEDLRLRSSVQEAVESVYPELARRGIELNYFVDPSIPRVIRGDTRRLHTVLSNFLRRAARSGDPTSMRLDVEKVGIEEQDILLRFRVRVEGGERTLETASQDTAAELASVDLRTSIGCGLVDLMGGELAQSSDELGFTLRFSYVGQPQTIDDDVSVLEGCRLLVVDDSQVVRSIVRTHAEAWGMEVTEAGSAAEGIEAIRLASTSGKPFDVALLDQEMGGKGGRELARLVRVSPAGVETRLILMAVLGRRLRPGLLLRDGFDAWVTKPLGSLKLRTVLLHVTAETSPSTGEPAIEALESGEARPMDADVLVVEDNVVNQKVARLLLDKLGCRTFIAADGEAALREAHEHLPDVILMDCHMPRMNGFEATRCLRESPDERVRLIPIIAMTADAMPEDRDRCLEAGMNDYLAKPVRTEGLRRVLEKWVDLHPETLGETEMNERDALDQTVIRSLKELGGQDDPGLFEELVNLFLDDTPPRIAELNDALQSKDVDRMERAAHALKSSTANLGAMALSTLFSNIEKAGKQKDLDEAADLVKSSEMEYDRVARALKAELS